MSADSQKTKLHSFEGRANRFKDPGSCQMEAGVWLSDGVSNKTEATTPGPGAANPCYGNNKTFVNGILFTGPDYINGFGTFCGLVIPSVLLDVFVLPYFTARFSFGSVVVCVLLQVVSLGLLFSVVFSDPGIIPRQVDFHLQVDPRTGEYRLRNPPRYQDAVQNFLPMRIKLCGTCNIYRPPRTTHCSVCDNCVECFDHHCPWIGNCVGKNNYGRFFGFVVATALLTVYGLGLAIAHFVLLCDSYRDSHGHSSVGEALLNAVETEPMTLVIIVYCGLFMWFTVGLLVYHTYLAVTNQSTYEHLKGMWSDVGNPFSRGISRNFAAHVFRPTFASRFNPRTHEVSAPKGLVPGHQRKKGSKSKKETGDNSETSQPTEGSRPDEPCKPIRSGDIRVDVSVSESV